MIVVIDNYDSFIYNVVQYLGELGEEVEVVRNDALSAAELWALKAEAVVISPGPCTPNEAGISMTLVRECPKSIPLLGICLGHQSIAQALGGTVARAAQVMHGRTSSIHHDGRGIFAGLPSPFIATRYHSLVVEKESLPDCLAISAWTETPTGEREEIMALRHNEYPVDGVQFHPESVASEYGHQLLKNFLTTIGNRA